MAPSPRVKITDPAELADLQRKKRKEFEDNIRKNRSKMTNWTKYAAWEETQKEYDRARYGITILKWSCILYWKFNALNSDVFVRDVGPVCMIVCSCMF